MGASKCNDMPLLPGRQLFIAGREVEIEGRVSAATVPRIIGSLPLDMTCEDEELDYRVDDYEANARVKTRVLSIRLEDTSVSDISSTTLSSSSKFVPPTNFYNKPQQPKTTKPLYALHVEIKYDILMES